MFEGAFSDGKLAYAHRKIIVNNMDMTECEICVDCKKTGLMYGIKLIYYDNTRTLEEIFYKASIHDIKC